MSSEFAPYNLRVGEYRLRIHFQPALMLEKSLKDGFDKARGGTNFLTFSNPYW